MAMEYFCDFKQKEVINVCDGSRLGFVCDLEFDSATGKIHKIIIPVEGKSWNLFSNHGSYHIPWRCIAKIGDDIILVEVVAEDFLETC